MTKYVAFIRGINSGVSVKMEVLRSMFEDMGFKNVRTVLATGNVLFESGLVDKVKMEQLIEDALDARLNYSAPTIIWTKDELERFIESDPFKGVEITRASVPQVTLLKEIPGVQMNFPVGGKGYIILNATDRAVCSVLDLSGASSPDLLQVLDRTFGKTVTTRNWKTMEKVMKQIAS